jgi:hypothetical protein
VRRRGSVARTPASVTLTFDEPALAMGTLVVVTGPTGDVQVGAPRLVDNTVTQDLRGGAPAGRYTVSWRVTSDDGHPISGTFAFTSRAAGTGTASAVPTPSPTPVSGTGGGGSWWVWLVLGVVIVVALAIGRRQAQAPADHQDPPTTVRTC